MMWASYLYANFSLLGLSILDLGPIYATDVRQINITQHHRFMPPPIRGGGILKTSALFFHQKCCVMLQMCWTLCRISRLGPGITPGRSICSHISYSRQRGVGTPYKPRCSTIVTAGGNSSITMSQAYTRACRFGWKNSIRFDSRWRIDFSIRFDSIRLDNLIKWTLV